MLIQLSFIYNPSKLRLETLVCGNLVPYDAQNLQEKSFIDHVSSPPMNIALTRLKQPIEVNDAEMRIGIALLICI
jgi:hypothetical protein